MHDGYSGFLIKQKIDAVCSDDGVLDWIALILEGLVCKEILEG